MFDIVQGLKYYIQTFKDSFNFFFEPAKFVKIIKLSQVQR